MKKAFITGLDREVVAVDEVDFELEEGQFAVMVGENGSGKSTFFNLAAGVHRPDTGRIFFGSRDVTNMQPYRRAKFVTRIFQSRDSGIPRAMTVSEVIKLAIETRENKARLVTGQDVCKLLERVRPKLSRVSNEQIWHLSGGEHQLVNLALAMVLAENQPDGKLLLLDEHVSQLDPLARDDVMDATDRMISDTGISAIMATHDSEIAVRFGTRQLIMKSGRIVRDLRGDQLIRSADFLRKALKAPGETGAHV